jgi:hypothetical protein
VKVRSQILRKRISASSNPTCEKKWGGNCRPRGEP